MRSCWTFGRLTPRVAQSMSIEVVRTPQSTERVGIFPMSWAWCRGAISVQWGTDGRQSQGQTIEVPPSIAIIGTDQDLEVTRTGRAALHIDTIGTDETALGPGSEEGEGQKAQADQAGECRAAHAKLLFGGGGSAFGRGVLGGGTLTGPGPRREHPQ